jgi:hypothetical protein
MDEKPDLLDRLIGQGVVMDLASPFLVIGTLLGHDGRYIELTDADVHDMRDTRSTRDQYVAILKTTGVRPNRRRTLIPRDQIVSVSALDDVIG